MGVIHTNSWFKKKIWWIVEELTDLLSTIKTREVNRHRAYWAWKYMIYYNLLCWIQEIWMIDIRDPIKRWCRK
jgi:hypothetical protein